MSVSLGLTHNVECVEAQQIQSHKLFSTFIANSLFPVEYRQIVKEANNACMYLMYFIENTVVFFLIILSKSRLSHINVAKTATLSSN